MLTSVLPIVITDRISDSLLESESPTTIARALDSPASHVGLEFRCGEHDGGLLPRTALGSIRLTTTVFSSVLLACPRVPTAWDDPTACSSWILGRPRDWRLRCPERMIMPRARQDYAMGVVILPGMHEPPHRLKGLLTVFVRHRLLAQGTVKIPLLYTQIATVKPDEAGSLAPDR